jgi:inner membrane protein
MDPVTHAIISAGAFAILGGDISIGNSAFIGCVAGSLSPDLDIVAKLRNDYYYLKHHRGSSHSFIGMLPMGFGIAALLWRLFPGSSFINIFLWTYIGCLSHVIFDFFNSYGAQLFWPISKKKYSMSVLKIFDIFVVIFSIAILFYRKSTWTYKGAILFLFVSYIFILGAMRFWARKQVSRFFKGRVNTSSVKVLPSSAGFFNWDFIIISQNHITVGQIDIFRGNVKNTERLRRVKAEEREQFLGNRAEKFFKEFTPLFHIRVKKRKNRIEVVYIDLRYRVKNRFKHHATAIYNAKGVLVECIFHPFRKENNVKF